MAAGIPLLTAGCLRLQFDRRGDRFGHTVFIVDASGEERLLLKSLEGDDSTPWPASPPLQNVHVEKRAGDVTVALAVGMAGRSHWSLAVEALPGGELKFDAACRLSELPEQLGSQYSLGDDVQVAGTASPLKLDISTLARVAVQSLDAAAVSVRQPQGEGRSVDVAANWGDCAWPATVRWQYSICLELRA